MQLLQLRCERLDIEGKRSAIRSMRDEGRCGHESGQAFLQFGNVANVVFVEEGAEFFDARSPGRLDRGPTAKEVGGDWDCELAVQQFEQLWEAGTEGCLQRVRYLHAEVDQLATLFKARIELTGELVMRFPDAELAVVRANEFAKIIGIDLIAFGPAQPEHSPEIAGGLWIYEHDP